MGTQSTSSAPGSSDRAGTLTFIGNATTIIRLGSFTVLTDPNFLHRGQRAYLGNGLWTRRLLEPAMQPRDLPSLDVVVLSHLHGDHFDRVAKRALDRSVPIVSTPAAQRRLERWGFTARGLQTWERHEIHHGNESLSVQSLPGTHARGVMRALLPPVMGSLLEHTAEGGATTRVYVSGDTLTGDHLDSIHGRHPDIDVAVVHLGGTRVLLHTVTMDAGQGVDFLRRITPRQAVPVHYDDYRVFRSRLSEFVAQATAAGFADTLRIARRGETLTL